MQTILLVEDSRELSDVISRELTGAGYLVNAIFDGLIAIDALKDSTPDLVILDWMLPNKDGLEILSEIRRKSSIPVLMLTARSDPADRVLGLELGADDYLIKPFEITELVARVRALFRRAERIRQLLTSDQSPDMQVRHWHTLVLDPSTRKCQMAGEDLELTRNEFDFLYLLMRNPGRTFNRIYLLDTVWGVNYINGDRAVDNTVMRIRKKIGELGQYFETVRGVGYRLRSDK